MNSTSGLAFIALASGLLGMLLLFSALNNQSVNDYTKQVLKR